MNLNLSRFSHTISRYLLIFIAVLLWNPLFADSFNEYVNNYFFLPYPKISNGNAAIYNYTWEPSSHIRIIDQSLGKAEITSYFSGTEVVTCNIYYYIQSPSGNITYGRTVQSHRVTCKNNNIRISAPKTEIVPGEGMQLSISFDNRNYAQNAQITYETTPHGIVSVSPSGYVKAYTSGQVTIQAKSNLSSNVSEVRINVRKVDPQSVEISPDPASVYCDGNLSMNAKVYPNGSSQKVTWSLYEGHSSVASISSYGTVSAYTPGQITVKATAENGVYALRTIKVLEPSFTRSSSVPSNNATGQNVFVTPSITFSHALYKADNFSNIALKAGSENVDGTVSMEGKTIVFNPSKPLKPNTKYTLSIPANTVKNKWGTPYSSAATLVFTTGNLEKLTLKSSLTNRFIKAGAVVQLTSSKSNATIYYTTDGSTPTEKSTRYTEALTISKDTELKAVAMLEGYENSSELHQSYIISNVAVTKTFPNDASPLYIYKDAIPCVTFSNKIAASSNVDKIVMQCVGKGNVDRQIVVSDSSIFIIPEKSLENGEKYKVTIPSNAIVTWQGEYNEAAEFSFTTGDFEKFISANGPEMGMAIKTDNTLYVWGSKFAHGSSSDGSYTYNVIPSPTSQMSDVIYASSGFMHHAAIKSDGSLWMWGRQYCGELGNGSTSNTPNNPTKVLSSGVRTVSAGGQTTAIIKTDNTLWMCGRNDFGQIGNGKTDIVTKFTKILDNVESAVAGWGVSFAITQDHQLYAWGHNDKGQLLNDTTDYDATPKIILEDVTAVSASATESNLFAAIKTNGDLVIWGKDYKTPKVLDNKVSNVSVGKDYLLFIKEDASMWAYGVNNYGQLGFGTFDSPQSPVKVMDNVKDVKAADESSFALKENGSVWSWGRNKNNLIGQKDNYSEISATPKQIMEGMPTSTLQGFVCNKKQIEVEVGSQAVIPVFPVPLTADYKAILWNSSNTECVTIDDRGIVYAKKAGFSDIIATITDRTNKKFSVKCLVKTTRPVGINMITKETTLKIWSHDSKIYVQNVPKGQEISVITIDGKTLHKEFSQGTTAEIPVTPNSLYIVRTGNISTKVICNK